VIPRLRSTYCSEADLTRPSLVDVRNPAGDRIATIDPLTRQRRDLTGRLEAVLTPQGWGLDTSRNSAAIPAKARPRDLYAQHEPRDARTGRILDGESRSGYTRGGTRRKTGRRRMASL